MQTVSIEQAARAHYAAVRARLMNPRPPAPVVVAEPAKEELPPIDMRESPLNPRWRIIMEVIARREGVTIPEIMSSRRAKKLVEIRHEIWWEISKQTSMTLPAIGRRFNKDHTTVLHGVRMHEQRRREKLLQRGAA